MKNVLKIIAVAISFAAASCADVNKTSPDGIRTTVIDQAVLDSATVLVVDSTDQRFASLTDANMMLVYKDSLLIVSHSEQTYGQPIISLYDRGNPLRRLGDYIPRGSDTDEMVACRIHLAGDALFVSDCYYTGRYCAIPLKNLPPADELRLSVSGVEERGVAITPFRDGLLVENPQCFSDDEAGIVNDVPRLLHFRNGRCLNPHDPVTYQVADVNTGADIHYNESCERICFVSHRQPLVEFYDDSLHLVHSLTFQSDDLQKIHIGKPQTTMHQRHSRGETGRGISATFDQTQRVASCMPSSARQPMTSTSIWSIAANYLATTTTLSRPTSSCWTGTATSWPPTATTAGFRPYRPAWKQAHSTSPSMPTTTATQHG